MTRPSRIGRRYRFPAHPFEHLEARRLLTASSVSTASNAAQAKALKVSYSAVTTVPTVSFSDVVVTEGRRGVVKYATVTVTLSEASSKPVVIAYKTQADTAKGAGSARDFVATKGSLTIKAGHTSGKIRIKIVGDNRAEADETFNVVATRIKNGTLAPGASGNSYGRIVIKNDDGTAASKPTLSVSNPTVTEGGAAAFVVSLSSPTSRDVTLRYTTVAGTASSSRFTSVSGILTIPAGQTSATIYVPTADDDAIEETQTFGLRLSAAANADLASDTAMATLLDNDASVEIPTVSANPASTSEGDLGLHTINFLVTLSSASSRTVTVNYATVDGTAKAGADYIPTFGTLTFAPGVTSLAVAVTLVNDTTYEATEIFGLALSNAVNATISQASAVGTIYDNDEAPTASIAGVSANEGASGDFTPFTFTVTLSAASGVTGTVNYSTIDGTAIAGVDYEAASGTLTFAPGVTSRTITINVIGNNAAEMTKVFTVNLSNPVNLKLAAASAAANGTILNDDTQTGITVSDGTATVAEGETATLTFTASPAIASATPVTVNYATADGTATAGTDYTSTSGTLTFAAGETSRTIAVTVNGTSAAGTKTFALNLSNPSAGTFIAATPVTGTIVDTGAPSVAISDNLAATSGGSESATGTGWLAASFETGSTDEVLTGVDLLLKQVTAGTAQVSIYSDAGLRPDSLLGSLDSPATYSSTLDETAFTSSGITLAANTKYWVVLRAISGEFGWSWTSADTGSGTGSGFTNEWDESSDSGVTWTNHDTNPLQMKVSVAGA